MTHNPKTRPRRNILSLLPFTLFAAFTVFSTLAPTAAAAAAVTVTGAAAYVQVNGKFYVHGGEYGNAVVVSQTLCLDLTKPWNVSNPEWTILASSPFVNSYHTATYSLDRKTLYFLGFNSGAKPGPLPTSFLNSYTIATNSWQAGNALNVAEPDRRDFQGALNPTTSKYMFLGGNFGNLGSIMSNKINVFDTRSGAFISEDDINLTTLTSVQGNVVGYIGQGAHTGLYTLAGQVSNNGSSAMFIPTNTVNIYSTEGKTWTPTVPISNTPPSTRVHGCVATSDDNSTLVMFGGFSSGINGTKALADLFILDGLTMTWKAGAAMADPVGVGYPACTIASNQLIVWGGFTISGGLPPTNNTMRVYDLASDKWVGNYTPSADYLKQLGIFPPPPVANVTQPSNGNNGGNNGGNGNGN
ncbi:hypothetical protein BGZ59_011784, partial [Podila verticillata]